MRSPLTYTPWRLAKEFFDLTAAQANHMSVLLLQAGLVVMLVAAVVHEVKLIHQAACLEHLQGAVNGNPVQLRVARVGHLIQAFGVEMLPRFVDELEQKLSLPG